MVKDITIGRYMPGKSVVHGLDPRTKICLSIVFMMLVTLAERYLSFAVIWLFSLYAAGFAGKSPGMSRKCITPIMFIALFTIFAGSLTGKGPPSAGCDIGLHFTREVFSSAAKVVLRLILLFSGASLLTATTTPASLTAGFESLMHPLEKLKFPVRDLSMMMSIALRFVPLLLDESEKIIRAQTSRGAVFGSGGLTRRARGMLPLLVPLFSGMLRRADDLATAMEARCYVKGSERSRIGKYLLSATDLVAAGMFAVLSAVVLCIEQSGRFVF